jgi:UDP-glucose 4-epimerase
VEWRDPASIDQALHGANAVVMLAAANEIGAARDPVAAAENTATQCLAWLQGAQRQAVPRFIYFSTIHVYGANDGALIDETSVPRPVHPYASTHLAAEMYVQSVHRQGGIAATIYRLSNAFGAPIDPGVNRWSLLVNDLARQAVLDGNLRLKSDGTQARDFIGMAVVCRAVEWCLRRESSEPEATVFNLGTGVSTTVYAMAQRIAMRAEHLMGRSFPIYRPSPPPDAPLQRYDLDVSRMASCGFSVPTDPDGEIDELLLFCQKHADKLRCA